MTDCYKIELRRSAEQEARKIPTQYLARIIEAIRALAGNPFPHGYRKLQGSQHSYRIRVGDYRVIYEVDTNVKIISIEHIRHRQDAYRK